MEYFCNKMKFIIIRKLLNSDLPTIPIISPASENNAKLSTTGHTDPMQAGTAEDDG